MKPRHQNDMNQTKMLFTPLPWFILCVLFIVSTATAETDFNLIQTPAGPQIAVDGRPVAARMFWGKPGFGSVSAGPEWMERSFTFTPSIDARATLHFRFGQKAGTVDLADVRIVALDTGEDILPPGSFATPEGFNPVWNIWPPDERNTVGQVEIADSSVHIRLTDPPFGTEWPDFHFWSDVKFLRPHTTYRCSFRVRATPARDITPTVYHVRNSWTPIGGYPGPFWTELDMARDAGVKFITFNVANCWAPPGEEPDWWPVDSVCRRILDAHPDAWLIPRVSLDAPTWWKNQHPEALMVYTDGRVGPKVSVSHRQYRADAAAHLERVCRHLTETFPDHIAGIHPCGQNTGEWFYEDSWTDLSGYDTATKQAWQEYAGNGTPVPDPISRRSAAQSLLLDPAQHGAIIRFNHFLQDEMADFILTLAKAARRGTGGNKLVVFFYGYHYEFGYVFRGPAASGHYNLAKVLQSPDIDILCAPFSYRDRDWLGTGPVMSSVESVLRAGKLWFNEDDTRTYLNSNAESHAQHGGLDDLEQTQSVLLRNTAQASIRGLGTWWMDHGAGTPGGWFADPELWQVMTDLQPLDRAMRSRDHPFQPPIAAILHENSILHLAGGSDVVGRNLIGNARTALGRSGTPYGQMMLQDVLSGTVDAPLQIFLSAWALTPQERHRLADTRPPGVTRVWCYAPGYILPEKTDIPAMQQVSGFRHRPIELNTAVATPTDRGHQLGLTNPWGPDQPVRPLFSVFARPEEVLATYSDGSPAVAMRERDDRGIDVFIGPPQITPEWVRALARLTDVHLYADDDASVWASKNYISVHAVQDPPLPFNSGVDQLVRDAITGKRISSVPKFTWALPAGDTRLLTWDPATGINTDIPSSATGFSLQQNHPNPFNPQTTFRFSLPETAPVSLILFDLRGREVARPVDNQIMTRGEHSISWTAGALPTGVYLYRLQAGSWQQQRKLVLIR